MVKDPISKAPNMDLTGAITAATLQHGLITIRAGLYSNCVRLMPPLGIEDAVIDEALDVLEGVIGDLAGRG